MDDMDRAQDIGLTQSCAKSTKSTLSTKSICFALTLCSAQCAPQGLRPFDFPPAPRYIILPKGA